MVTDISIEKYNEKRKKNDEIRIDVSFVSLISPCWSSLRIAFSAVYWSASVRLERDFTFLATISTNCLMHLSS
jgi:hypothetical protein